MRPSEPGQTLFIPTERTSIADRATTGLPPDLLSRAASRLQVLAWLYAFTFFMAAFFPALLFPDIRRHLLEHPAHWVPGVTSIAVGVLVALAIGMVRLRPALVTVLALAFEVVSSYGIAAAEFLQPGSLNMGATWIGLSWVAVWMLLFNVVVPTVPRYAVMAALLSVTAVPVMVLISLSVFPPTSPPNGILVFLAFGFPYLLVVIMAYVGARVVYNLGTEVTRARELGSYVLEERLGAGGMGEVWRASHRLLARPAAIKLIRSPEPGTPAGIPDDLRRRFEREAQVIAQLRSPHTVTLFDFGIAQEGTFYYVMELLEGVDAEALINRFGPIPAERVVHILRQMCHSLSEAESCGLVHRDIKPANIFLCRYGEDCDFVKLLDFGLVKAFGEPGGELRGREGPALTRENLVQGTPAFIAPEQALGERDLDGRADIYAIGCVGYWLLTGQFVFTADTTMGYLVHHIHTPARPPSTIAPSPIPPRLDEVILACLAKEPAQRPQSARELSCRLQEVDGADRWNAATAKAWWDAHLPASAGSSA